MPKTLTVTNDVAVVSRKSYTYAFPNMPGNSPGCIYGCGRLLLLYSRSLFFSLSPSSISHLLLQQTNVLLGNDSTPFLCPCSGGIDSTHRCKDGHITQVWSIILGQCQLDPKSEHSLERSEM